MTTPQPSLTVTFENPKMKVSLAGSTSAGLDLGANLGAKLGMQARQKLGVPYIAVDGVEHTGDWAAPTRVDITPGSHHVEGYFKLKGLPVKRGRARLISPAPRATCPFTRPSPRPRRQPK